MLKTIDQLSLIWQALIGGYLALVFILFILDLFLVNYGYHYFRFEMNEDELIFQKGYFFRSITYVPFSRIQHIETEQGPFLRQAQLMKVIIHTAATSHSIAGLSIEDGTNIQKEISMKSEMDTNSENR
ncbi:PH domain-containing protein [Facklamia sp. P12955]|uniref:PH domain-containing protein n=1 Tax=Facklamia sp. P12955 TaxID=3421946 RepID=UPI003D16A520